MPLEIVTIPCLSDNYAFLVHGDGKTALVDAPEAGPILEHLALRGWDLDEIWLTHHHDDHVQATAPLKEKFPSAVTRGNKHDAARLPHLDAAFERNDSFTFAGQTVEVIFVPGHTVEHIAFYIASDDALFSADSLMAFGCGRVFEGTLGQMWDSLSRLASLPEQTVIYSGHEYVEANGQFALTIEPDNSDVAARLNAASENRAAGGFNVPSTLADEQKTNPFLRAGLHSVKDYLDMPSASDAEAFAEIRRRKDKF